MNKVKRIEWQDARDIIFQRFGGYVVGNEKEKVCWESDVEKLEKELDEAYAEMRKQRKTITAVFHREVWDRAEKARNE